MKILFISTSCSKKKYQEVYKTKTKKLIEPQQKFCSLLIDGMSKVEGTEIECITALPVSSSTVSKKIFTEEVECISSALKYRYLAFQNGKISRYLTLYRNSRKAVKNWIDENRNEQKVIICDALSYFITRPAQKVAKKNDVKIVGIITDLPLLSTGMKERKESIIKKVGMFIFQYLTNISLENYDAYIPLTKSINDYVNKLNKPMLIVEGSVDIKEKVCMAKNYAKKRLMLYAGGIYEKYGIKNLVKAFMQAKTNGYELHIYGEGSYVHELQNLSKISDKIKYKGMVDLEEIVAKEKEAMILVNPRPSNEEFSKFSFPSKTLEYMASGTPLLTTRLSGIPKEYFDYVFCFSGETVDDMSAKITEICSIDDDILKEKGKEALQFVLEKKNNNIQGRKIVEYIENIIVKKI